jgi:hypothetical protein
MEVLHPHCAGLGVHMPPNRNRVTYSWSLVSLSDDSLISIIRNHLGTQYYKPKEVAAQTGMRLIMASRVDGLERADT